MDIGKHIATLALDVTPGDNSSISHQKVTEGRDGPNYSSCADLAHYILQCLGITDTDWINRSPQWVSGWNIIKLVRGARRTGCWVANPKDSSWCKVGSIVLIGDPKGVNTRWEHVFVVTHIHVQDATSTRIMVAEWGQKDARDKQCGKLKLCTVNAAGRIIGSVRHVLGYIDPEKLDVGTRYRNAHMGAG
jgi:hypothetical protein